MKYTIEVEFPVSQSADGRKRHVSLETHELYGYKDREEAEAAIRRTCNHRCKIRNVKEEIE